MEQVLGNLIAARAVIADRKQWTQKTLHLETEIGRRSFRHPFRSPSVLDQYCALGALCAVVTDDAWHHAQPERKVLDEVADYYFGLISIIDVNDGRRASHYYGLGLEIPVISYLDSDAHANVLFCYDKAIAAVRQLLDESRNTSNLDFEIETLAPAVTAR